MEAVKDIVAGTIAGMAGTVMTMPFDVIRVRLQTSQLTGRAAVAAIAQGGALSFFRGVSAPLAAAAPANAIIFAVEGVMARRMVAWGVEGGGGGGDGSDVAAVPSSLRAPSVPWHTSAALHALSGAVAGLAQVPVSIPTELLKLQMQVQMQMQTAGGSTAGPPSAIRISAAHAGVGAGAENGESGAQHGRCHEQRYLGQASHHTMQGGHDRRSFLPQGYVPTAPRNASVALWSPMLPASGGSRGLWPLGVSVLSRYGWGGLYRGGVATTLRDTIAFSFYFGTYDVCKRWSMRQGEETASTGVLMFAGGTAGVASWLFSYPLDVIKSTIQGMPLDTPLAQRRMMAVVQSRWRAEGGGFLARGLAATLIRAFVCSAVVFPVFEALLEAFHAVAPRGHQDEIHR